MEKQFCGQCGNRHDPQDNGGYVVPQKPSYYDWYRGTSYWYTDIFATIFMIIGIPAFVVFAIVCYYLK